MKKSVFSAALVAAMFAGGFAQAAATSGTIKSIDNPAEAVTLENGVTYTFDQDMYRHPVLDGYRPGDKVTVVWSKMGDKHVALALSPDHSSGVAGKIKAVDPANRTVTLENGTVYTFDNVDGEDIDLSGFRAGDDVTIQAVTQGDKEMGRSIASTSSAEVTGKVQSADQGAMTLTLEDGTVYHFADDSGVDVSGFLPGDMVKITALTLGTTHIARAVSSAN